VKLLLLKAALSQPKNALCTSHFRFSAEKARLPPICNDVNIFFFSLCFFDFSSPPPRRAARVP
jgi:hypothetical protein